LELVISFRAIFDLYPIITEKVPSAEESTHYTVASMLLLTPKLALIKVGNVIILLEDDQLIEVAEEELELFEIDVLVIELFIPEEELVE
jgi:hypothetical protein